MSKTIIETIVGIIFIITGVVSIIYYKSSARKHPYVNPKNTLLNEKELYEIYKEEIENLEIVFIIGGIFFIIFGLLLAFHIIK